MIASAQTVAPRAMAAYDGDQTGVDEPLWETWLAVGANAAVAVYNWGQQAIETADQVEYAVAEYDPNDPNAPWTWGEEGLIPRLSTQFSLIVDPSIVYDPPDPNDPNDLGRFVAATFANNTDRPGKRAVLNSVYEVGDPNGFEPWKVVGYRTVLDKPWLVRGQRTAAGSEYYMIWFTAGEGYSYARTRDSWQHWTKPESGLPADVGGKTIKVGTQAVSGAEGAQPAVNPDDPNAPLYLAYRSLKKIHFLAGVDDDTDPNDPSITFSRLRKVCGLRAMGTYGQVYAKAPLNSDDVRPYLPSIYKAKTIPWLAVDPTDAGRLYVVYQDTVESNPDPNDTDVDVDIYVRVLTDNGAGWCVGDRVRVNQDPIDPNNPPSTPADQFIPSAMVDALGRLHVIYYDDRRFPNQIDGQSGAKLDVYHAIGEYDDANDTVAILSDTRLYALDPNDPNDPEAIDLGNWIRGPGEYGGVAYDESRDEILTSYAGTDPNKPGSYKQVIYSNHVTDLP